MNKRLYEKTIIVTGASSGIGKSIANILIRDFNCKVVGVARSAEKLLSLKGELGVNLIPYKMDVKNLEDFENLKKFVTDNELNISGLINCAGILPKFQRFESVSVETAKEVIDINFFSLVYSVKVFTPLLKVNESPFIVNVLSSSALCPFSGVSLYSASKSAGEKFSTSITYENKDINVLTVMPGFTKTDIMRNQNANEKEKGIIDKFSSNPDKVAKRIVKSISKGKKRLIIGFDAHFMNFLFKFFPRTAPCIIGWFLKKSKLKLFEEI